MSQSRSRGYDNEDLESEFDQSEKRSTWRADPLSRDRAVHVPQHSAAVPSKQLLSQEIDKEEWRARRYHLLSMDAYSRHKHSHYLPLTSCTSCRHISSSNAQLIEIVTITMYSKRSTSFCGRGRLIHGAASHCSEQSNLEIELFLCSEPDKLSLTTDSRVTSFSVLQHVLFVS